METTYDVFISCFQLIFIKFFKIGYEKNMKIVFQDRNLLYLV
jgi:hypothetical protein